MVPDENRGDATTRERPRRRSNAVGGWEIEHVWSTDDDDYDGMRLESRLYTVDAHGTIPIQISNGSVVRSTGGTTRECPRRRSNAVGGWEIEHVWSTDDDGYDGMQIIVDAYVHNTQWGIPIQIFM